MCANLHVAWVTLLVNVDVREWKWLNVCEATCESMCFACSHACECGFVRACSTC